jgi:hypothetical protein
LSKEKSESASIPLTEQDPYNPTMEVDVFSQGKLLNGGKTSPPPPTDRIEAIVPKASNTREAFIKAVFPIILF